MLSQWESHYFFFIGLGRIHRFLACADSFAQSHKLNLLRNQRIASVCGPSLSRHFSIAMMMMMMMVMMTMTMMMMMILLERLRGKFHRVFRDCWLVFSLPRLHYSLIITSKCSRAIPIYSCGSVELLQGLVNVCKRPILGFCFTSPSSICWRLDPQYLGDVQLGHLPTPVQAGQKSGKSV